MDMLTGAEVWAKDAEATTQMASADTTWRTIPAFGVNASWVDAILIDATWANVTLVNADKHVAGNR
jgi:hypothetical protein